MPLHCRSAHTSQRLADPAIQHDQSRTESTKLRLALFQEYVLKRLVRGLGSGRQGARQGFALALAALLGARPSLSPASVLELMDQHLPFSKSMQAGGLQAPGTDLITLCCLRLLGFC